MLPRHVVWLLAAVPALATPARAVPCGVEGIITVVADNRSADAEVDLVVSGTRTSSASSCEVRGTGLATTYATTIRCSGTGPVTCGRIGGLAPGMWVHRVAVQVTDSARQVQAQRSAVLARTTAGVSNLVAWTVFGQTFVVTEATGADLRAQLDAARAYTASHPSPALVRFSRESFPGAAAPTTFTLQTAPACASDTCADGGTAAYCFEGSQVTVDALDGDAAPGGFVLAVGPCDNSLLRVSGHDNTLRGLVCEGSRDPAPARQADTIVITGLESGGNRLEQCTVIGPTLGDAVSIEGDPGNPGAGTAPENTILATEVTGAADKGVKVGYGGVARIERCCIHDNTHGGIQATLGGSITAVENVIQHNLIQRRQDVDAGPQNGISVGVPNPAPSAYPNALTTRGNIVRFNGARGISVVNHATASLTADAVTSNYRAGLRIETTVRGVTPTATVRGSVFACNYAPGVCSTGEVCRENTECPLADCRSSGEATGVGVALKGAACPPPVTAEDPPCAMPEVDLGGASDAGRNAFTSNANPLPPRPGFRPGINVSSELVAASDIPAAGNQWEHCDVPAPDPAAADDCNLPQVAASDVRVEAGATPLDLGTPASPRRGPEPVVTAISPPRPRAGELVRVYGGPFDAIDGGACHPAGLPDDPCSAENPAIVARNAADRYGNAVTVALDGVSYPADVHQVTPSMIVFAMPVDCYAPGTITIARGDTVAAAVVLCDPSGCADRPLGAPCDDDNACTLGDTCRPEGSCGGDRVDCNDRNVCTRDDCDSRAGCTHIPVGCDDADACTADACDPHTGCAHTPVGCDDADACTADACDPHTGCTHTPVGCDDADACTADACDPGTGCTHRPQPDGTACVGNDPCRGPAACRDGRCDPGPPLSCGDGDFCTDDTCDPVAGCLHTTRTGILGVGCHVTALRALLEARALPTAALADRLDCVERALVKAAAAGPGTRAGTRSARRADRCLAWILRRVQRAQALPAAMRAAVAREGEATRIALAQYFGLHSRRSGAAAR